jgi:hypothetical protein
MQYLAQMFTMIRWFVLLEIWVPAAKVKVTFRGQYSVENVCMDSLISLNGEII